MIEFLNWWVATWPRAIVGAWALLAATGAMGTLVTAIVKAILSVNAERAR